MSSSPEPEPHQPPPVPNTEPERIAHDTRLLAAMSDETRLTLLRTLHAADNAVCVCDLEAAVPVGQSAVSQALTRLHNAGLVTRRKEGTWRYYRPTPQARTLLSTLDTIRNP